MNGIGNWQCTLSGSGWVGWGQCHNGEKQPRTQRDIHGRFDCYLGIAKATPHIPQWWWWWCCCCTGIGILPLQTRSVNRRGQSPPSTLTSPGSGCCQCRVSFGHPSAVTLLFSSVVNNESLCRSSSSSSSNGTEYSRPRAFNLQALKGSEPARHQNVFATTGPDGTLDKCAALTWTVGPRLGVGWWIAPSQILRLAC